MTYAKSAAFCDENALLDGMAEGAARYIGNMTFAGYRDAAARLFPFILPMIAPDRVTGAAFLDYLAWMNEISWEFEDQENGGRGVAYNLAQRNTDNRKIGILSLLKCFSESGTEILGPDKVILDALAGNGTIVRFVRTEKMHAPRIISADLSSLMVEACFAQELPCIRQSATHSLLRDATLDGILIAYGSHHLDEVARKAASAEAFRTIKNGGRLVLHDFEIGTPAADWFEKVVHPFSRTGHPHPHFTRNEMRSLLEDAGFQNVRVFGMADPFVLKGASAADARANALMHLCHMYDLVKIDTGRGNMLDQLESHAREIFGEIQIDRTASGYTATVPREALVAVGTKMAST